MKTDCLSLLLLLSFLHNQVNQQTRVSVLRETTNNRKVYSVIKPITLTSSQEQHEHLVIFS